MQRSGPLFAKAWNTGKAPTPRGQHRRNNPMPQGIVQRVKAACPVERAALIKQAASYLHISPRTKRRILQFS